MQPLVSCIATTADRHEFVPMMLRCFSRQTWPRKELIVVDGGREPFEDLCAGIPDVRYIRASPEVSVGMCLNMAAEAARGPILQRIDDDDYYHPRFLERAVRTLLRTPRPAETIVTWDCYHILMRGERWLRFSGHGTAAGGTLCFARKLWQRTPFRDDRSEDYFFFHDTQAPVKRVCAPNLYIYVRHGLNGWGKVNGYDTVDDQFRTRPIVRTLLRQIVQDKEDIAFYRSIAYSSPEP